MASTGTGDLAPGMALRRQALERVRQLSSATSTPDELRRASRTRASAKMDRWGRWYVETTSVDALRLDAVGTSDPTSTRAGSKTCALLGRLLPAVGSTGAATCETRGLPCTRSPTPCSSDVPLHYHLHQASVSDGNVDLSRLWENTLTASIQNCPSPSLK